MVLEYYWKFFEKIVKYQISRKIRPAGAELFRADSRMDRHDGVKSSFTQFFERAYKCRSQRETN
jgi:hypothetical protein